MIYTFSTKEGAGVEAFGSGTWFDGIVEADEPWEALRKLADAIEKRGMADLRWLRVEKINGSVVR